MGKDGTQLLRHCVRLLVLVSTDLVAVRLSGIPFLSLSLDSFSSVLHDSHSWLDNFSAIVCLFLFFNSIHLVSYS